MAQNIFAQSAKEALGGSKVMQNRTKITTKDLISKYPNGITVTEFDFIAKSDGTGYPVFAFAEDDTRYFNGGALANKVASKWAAMYDGDIETASAKLKDTGGCKIKLSTKTTKTGRTVTGFDPVEE